MRTHRSTGLRHKEMAMRAHSIPSMLAVLLTTGAAASAAAPGTPVVPATAVAQERANAPLFIVQGSNVEVASHGVLTVGAEPKRTLEVIRAVAANLTPSQVARLRATPGLRVYADRQLRTSSLLGSVQTVVNNTNSTLANTFVVPTVTQLATPTVFTLLATPVLSSVTSPVVQGLSSSSGLQDGTGVAGLTLAYQTNYPALIGADSLQSAGVTGKGITIAMLDTGLWND